MKPFLLLALGIFAWACSNDPKPIHFGKDACHACKMTLMDPVFGAEVVTQKGKTFVFDDVNCLMDFLNKENQPDEAYAHLLVVNHAEPEQLIDAKTAFYVLSDEIKSPMASRVAAFASETDMRVYRSKYNGVYLAWGELVTQFK